MKHLQSAEEFAELKNSPEKHIFLFSAEWCGDCRFIEPFMPEVEAKYDQYTFIHIDRDKFIDTCIELDVFGIPSFIAFEGGKELGRFVSKDRKTQEEIEKFIESL
ncbi:MULTISPECIES: thioredoxin family protein [Niallia]|uniref:Thiol reductase thioredoxin n=1 Tax=Niallia circulans TaxID=1397 RepID=A0A268F8U0_NIACI|nr:thioredoxin family protein [Niallia circulans]AYV67507.1 thioredoxin [Niallia circulans]AYV74136.1 thioredoxin [Niallia circulans]NRG28574.1 thioredoxin family protein [Niallia circulans]PAD81802.1 thiol reductase thioredoxin [Niallia circulans]QJX63456.1 thioredoxin family protein [Niallia circulans]